MLYMGCIYKAFEMMKGTFTNVLPMIIIGAGINWTFAVFITSTIQCLYNYIFSTPSIYRIAGNFRGQNIRQFVVNIFVVLISLQVKVGKVASFVV